MCQRFLFPHLVSPHLVFDGQPKFGMEVAPRPVLADGLPYATLPGKGELVFSCGTLRSPCCRGTEKIVEGALSLNKSGCLFRKAFSLESRCSYLAICRLVGSSGSGTTEGCHGMIGSIGFEILKLFCALIGYSRNCCLSCGELKLPVRSSHSVMRSYCKAMSSGAAQQSPCVGCSALSAAPSCEVAVFGKLENRVNVSYGDTSWDPRLPCVIASSGDAVCFGWC